MYISVGFGLLKLRHAYTCLVQGMTPLHFAALQGQTEMTQQLLLYGAEVGAKACQVCLCCD